MEEKVTYGSYEDFLKSTFKGQSDEAIEDERRTLIRMRHTGMRHTGQVPQDEAERTIRHIEAEQERRKREEA